MNPSQQNLTGTFKVARPLRRTITFAFLAVGFTAVLVTALFAYYSAKESLQAGAYNQLRSVREVLQNSIESYLQTARHDLAGQADSDTVRLAVVDLQQARADLRQDLATGGFPVDESFMKTIRADVKDYYDRVLITNLKKVSDKDPGASETVFMHPDPEANLLQYVYTVKNPAKIGAKSDFTGTADILRYTNADPNFLKAFAGTPFAKTHEYTHRIMTAHRERFRYYDIFICDIDGNVVYSNFKELDFQGNLRTGPQSDTGLGQAFKGALGLKRGEIFTTDLAQYPISYNAPAIFISTPVMDGDVTRGVFIYQLPLDVINEVMTFNRKWEQIGLGKSGECYLVGLDGANSFKQITESRFPEQLKVDQKRLTILADGVTGVESTSGVLSVKTKATEAVAAGEKGESIYPDYRGQPVLGSYAPLESAGARWAVIAEIDQSEAFAAARQLAIRVGITGAILLALLGLAAVLFARRLSHPVDGLREAVERVAQGDETARAPIRSRDEIGQLATAFNGMVAERASVRQKLEEENKRLQANIQQLLMVVADASDGDLSVRAPVTEGALGNVADALNLMFENVGDLIKNAKDVSERVAAAASEINRSAEELSSGADRQSEELLGASSGARELSADARGVAEACQEAAHAAAQSEEAADRGARIVREVIVGMEKIRESVQVNGKKIKRLGERSMEIGGILKTINEISAQTDMLALNASIEAGRAGEAGRGFNAVAEQVRALAERAKLATQQVEKLVSDIQQETSEAVAQTETQTQQVESGAQKVAQAGDALNNIVQVSSQSRSAVTKISSSATEQATKTGVMLGAVTSAAEIAEQSRGQVSGTRATSEILSSLAKSLDAQLDQFKLNA
ncbi:MAG TPA: methyl-accepting chemotaxis protein [Chthoniobacteraceae bacterium]|jgi:methyl-accepting chemotaxis protein